MHVSLSTWSESNQTKYRNLHPPTFFIIMMIIIAECRVRYEQLFRYAIYIAKYVATDDDPTSHITSFTFML